MTLGRKGRHPGHGRVTEMIATMEGRCPLCRTLYRPGEQIKSIGYRNWGHPDCVERAGRV